MLGLQLCQPDGDLLDRQARGYDSDRLDLRFRGSLLLHATLVTFSEFLPDGLAVCFPHRPGWARFGRVADWEGALMPLQGAGALRTHHGSVELRDLLQDPPLVILQPALVPQTSADVAVRLVVQLVLQFVDPRTEASDLLVSPGAKRRNA